LLAYLDDTLEPAQAKLIGQKVAESDAAQELMARIKQVTRRRRLTTPPSGPGAKTDPNMIAEYLDNTLPAEQLAEIEEICLASDVHLAEIAACHQILTLVLGEPALVPPTARQRMYGLIRGPEAIPFRKPAKVVSNGYEAALDEGPETDETLRLGLPVSRTQGAWTQRLALGAAALALVALLVVAIIQVLPPPGENTPDPNLQAVGNANESGADKKPEPKETGSKKETDGKASAADKERRDDKAVKKPLPKKKKPKKEQSPEPRKDKKTRPNPSATKRPSKTRPARISPAASSKMAPPLPTVPFGWPSRAKWPGMCLRLPAPRRPFWSAGPRTMTNGSVSKAESWPSPRATPWLACPATAARSNSKTV
jgi:hypothetical protein